MEKLEFEKRRARVKYCPCNKSNRDGKFVPYKGYENKGYCHSCGKTFLPERQLSDTENYPPISIRLKPSAVRFHSMPAEVLSSSVSNSTESNFAKWLISLYDYDTAVELLNRYKVGTSSMWQGANTFWQVDREGRIRTGKIMLYDSSTGKRIKNPRNYISWEHVEFKSAGFLLKQCFFGEHLLNLNKICPVAVVESEKTAMIASLFMPQFIWLATGGKIGCKWHLPETGKVLSGRTVYLFPDLSENAEVFQLWQRQAKEATLNIPGTRFIVSDYLERNATIEEKQAGMDLADYLIKYNLKQFRMQQEKAANQPQLEPILSPVKKTSTGVKKPFNVFDHYERDVWYSQGKKIDDQ